MMSPQLMATKIGPSPSRTTAMALLEQLAALDSRTMSPETADTILHLHFDPADQERVRVLSAKAREGALTPSEQADLDESIRVADLLAILQSRARRALKRNGHSS